MPTKPTTVVPWPAASFEERIRDCLLMLRLHGAVTEDEVEKIKKRIAGILKKRQERQA